MVAPVTPEHRIEQRDEGKRNGNPKACVRFSASNGGAVMLLAPNANTGKGAQAVLLKPNDVARIKRLIDNLLGSRLRQIWVVWETDGARI